MIDTLLGFIAPHSCYGCGETGAVACESCIENIKDEGFGRCIMCHKLTSREAICTLCASRDGIRAAWCIGERSTALKAILDAYKFSRVKAASRVLARLLHESVPLIDASITVTNVPTAPSHVRQRGYDHAGLIAKEFARFRGLPYREILSRHDTTTQHFSSRWQRLKQAEGAFSANPIKGGIFLIDDIVTTGATLQASVRVLKEAGASEVYVGVVARQPLDDNAHL